MICEKCYINKKENVYYTKYLQDNFDGIEKNRKHPAMIVCPGGGYLFTSDHEAEPVALHFLNLGYQTFVLRYSTADKGDATFPKPLFELASLVAEVRKNAQIYNIDSEKIAVIGFSAGANITALLATMWQKDFLKKNLQLDNSLFKPNAVVLGYPMLDFNFEYETLKKDKTAKTEIIAGEPKVDFMEKSRLAFIGEKIDEASMKAVSPIEFVSTNTPPTFIWHTANDSLVYVGNSLLFSKKLSEFEIPFELHVFEKGPHGMSLANSQVNSNLTENDCDVAVWSDLARRFLKRHFKL